MDGDIYPRGRTDGGYSHARLLALAVLWLIAGAVTVAATGGFVAVAEDPRGCESPPCAYPAQANVGGIILGTDFMDAADLIAAGVDEDPPLTMPTPPGRALEEENIVVLGTNDVQAENFMIYTTWYYFDDRVADDVPVYLWINSESASMTGSGECGDGNDDLGGFDRCDLQAFISETSADHIFAEVDCSGWFSSWCPDYSGLQQLWVVQPEDDTCPTTLDLSFLCLGLMPDGGVSVMTVNAQIGQVATTDFMVRAHRLAGVQDDFEEANKRMTLDNVYMEIRYGKGEDRRFTPSGAVDSMGDHIDWADSSDTTNEFGYDPASHPDFAQPMETDEGRSALSNTFLCEGGGPSTVCVPPEGTLVNEEGMSYDNIHLLDDETQRYIDE